MSEQKIPGVRDAKRPPITEQTYAILIVITLAAFAVAMLVVAQLPHDGTVDVINFDLVTSATF
jgi:hypothetical protein